MEKILLICCLATAVSAIFFPFITLPGNQQQMMRVCIYSVNPARFQPKCILCPSSIYPTVLQTCLRSAGIPPNISFTQASCLEQNCLINRGKRSVDVRHPQNLLEDGDRVPLPLPYEDGPEEDGADQQQQQKKEETNSEEKNSGEKNSEYQELKKFHIVGTEEVFISDFDDYEDGMDYATLDG